MFDALREPGAACGVESIAISAAPAAAPVPAAPVPAAVLGQ